MASGTGSGSAPGPAALTSTMADLIAADSRAAADIGPATVTALVSYPIKGCAGVHHERVDVGRWGLPHDREFMLVNPDGRFLSQRTNPGLAVLRPQVHDDGARLVVEAPGREPFELAPTDDGPRRDVTVHKWSGHAVDQGDAAAGWFAAALGVDCRLVRVAPDHPEQRAPHLNPEIVSGFADGHPLLICSESSLTDLNERLALADEPALPMNRFRPNIVLGGWPVPHTEDRVRTARIGGVEVEFERDCIRCAVPTVDQATGRRTGFEPTRTLATYRRHPDGGVAFGMKPIVRGTGPVAIGDPVTVHTAA